jgi:transposase-like protein
MTTNHRFTPEQLAQAHRMLEVEGASYKAVAETLGFTPRAVKYRFPGYGWTREQAVEATRLYAQLKQIEERNR